MHTAPLSISALEKLSQDPLTFNCITTGLPATEVRWVRRTSVLVSDDTYSLSQALQNGTTSTYDNFLTISDDLQQTQGLYRCIAFSDQMNQALRADISTTSGMYTPRMSGRTIFTLPVY